MKQGYQPPKSDEKPAVPTTGNALAKPTHDNLCRLSVIFCGNPAPLDYGALFRVNEWLKTHIAAAAETANFSGIASIEATITFVKTPEDR